MNCVFFCTIEVHSFIHIFTHWFVQSFIHVFIHLLRFIHNECISLARLPSICTCYNEFISICVYEYVGVMIFSVALVWKMLYVTACTIDSVCHARNFVMNKFEQKKKINGKRRKLEGHLPSRSLINIFLIFYFSFVATLLTLIIIL